GLHSYPKGANDDGMIRRPSDPGDTFSFAELAVAGGMTKRAFQHVADAERPSLLPVGSGVRVLKRTAVIGAFMDGGVPLLVAAQLARAILDEFNQNDGEAPSGLNGLVHDVANDPILRSSSRQNDYWYHLALYQNPAIYRRGEKLKSDALINIF